MQEAEDSYSITISCDVSYERSNRGGMTETGGASWETSWRRQPSIRAEPPACRAGQSGHLENGRKWCGGYFAAVPQLWQGQYSGLWRPGRQPGADCRCQGKSLRFGIPLCSCVYFVTIWHYLSPRGPSCAAVRPATDPALCAPAQGSVLITPGLHTCLWSCIWTSRCPRDPGALLSSLYSGPGPALASL